MIFGRQRGNQVYDLIIFWPWHGPCFGPHRQLLLFMGSSDCCIITILDGAEFSFSMYVTDMSDSHKNEFWVLILLAQTAGSLEDSLKYPLQPTQPVFMRFTGTSKRVSVQNNLECRQLHIQCTWIEIFARFHITLADTSSKCPPHMLFVDDIDLALKGCTTCWAICVFLTSHVQLTNLFSKHFDSSSLSPWLDISIVHSDPFNPGWSLGPRVSLPALTTRDSQTRAGNFLDTYCCSSRLFI